LFLKDSCRGLTAVLSAPDFAFQLQIFDFRHLETRAAQGFDARRWACFAAPRLVGTFEFFSSAVFGVFQLALVGFYLGSNNSKRALAFERFLRTSAQQIGEIAASD